MPYCNVNAGEQYLQLYSFFWVIPRHLNFICRLLERSVSSFFIGGVSRKNNRDEIFGGCLLQHNSLISTIPWLPFLTLTQCRFSLTYLLWPPLPVLALHSLFLYSDPPAPCPHSSELLRLFLSQTFLHINTPTISSRLFFLLTTPMKVEQAGCCEMSKYNIQMPGNHPQERIQHSEYGKSLKSRISTVFPS